MRKKKIIKKGSVAVIIQTYNDGKLLVQAIKSIINQTYKNIKIIILDDGSDQNSRKHYKDFIKNNKKIKYYYRRNMGIVKSSQDLLNLAKKTDCEYFAKMDGDDISHHKRIEKQVKSIIKNNYDLVGCNFIRINKNDKKFELNKCTNDKISRFNQLCVESIYAHGSILFKRELVDKNLLYYTGPSQKFPYPEDYNMYCNLINKCKLGTVNEYLYLYRIHKKSYSEDNKVIYNKQLNKSSKKFFKKNLSKFNEYNDILRKVDFFDYIILLKILFRHKLWNNKIIFKSLIVNFSPRKLLQIGFYIIKRKLNKAIYVIK
tara:strand:+ start:1588 stop:2535 length:948 start_codon:yes stop_codon:yes gene_type:complete